MKLRQFDLSSAALHILAMVLMLMDHTWATLLPSQRWLTCMGRIAYPIFAFMIVEGYFHTHDFKKYMRRLLALALISEIPFNLMYGSQIIYPYHQNVIWTFLISLGAIFLIDRVRAKGKLWLTVLASVGIGLVAALLGLVTMADYYAAGVLTVLVFYFFHRRTWWSFLGQFIILFWLNVEVLGGRYYDITLFGMNFELVEQGLALVALLPIWLYRGRQGYHSKAFQYGCYAFYPVHCLILALL